MITPTGLTNREKKNIPESIEEFKEIVFIKIKNETNFEHKP